MTSLIERRNDAGVVELRLARPERRNALNTQLLEELRDHIRDLRDDTTGRVVLLTGEGTVFSAGADVNEFSLTSGADNDRLHRLRLVIDVIRGLLELEQPSISLVQGSAVGAGWGLAMACGRCWATEATRFTLPEIAKGFRLPQPIVARLAQLVGPMRAAELVLSGETITGLQGFQSGAVSRTFSSADEMSQHAWRHARELARHSIRTTQAATDPLRAISWVAPNPTTEYAWNEEST